MDKTLTQLADQAGTMHGGLANVLARLAAVEHRLTDLRADLLDPESVEAAAILSATDELAQLADYVADLRARTAPAGQPSPDGETTPLPAHIASMARAVREQLAAAEAANRMGADWAAQMHG